MKPNVFTDTNGKAIYNYEDRYMTTNDGVRWVMLKYANQKVEAAGNRWISVNDRLPEKYGEYFCSTKARPHGWVVVYAKVGWICSDDYPVTHWMPLPEPPEDV